MIILLIFLLMKCFNELKILKLLMKGNKMNVINIWVYKI